jgi:ABC-type Mn2+/Zn2+ transport system ATPase subunit
MSTDEVLVVSRLAKTYRAGVAGCAASVDVLRDVSLSVRAGQLATIEGTRGAGKTTLLMCAAGLLRPDRGIVEWPALTPSPDRPPAAIAYATERAPMYGFLTVRESLAYGRAVRTPYEADTEGNADAALDLAGLTAMRDVRVGLLSALDRSRLIIALALVGSPRLLLVDDLNGVTGGAAHDAFALDLARIAAMGVGVLWAFRPTGDETGAAYALRDGQVSRASPADASRRWTRRRVLPPAPVVHPAPVVFHPGARAVREP